MSDSLADLIITFAAVNGPALAAFTELSTAAEAMVETVTAAVTAANEALATLGATVEESAAAVTSSTTAASEAVTRFGAAAEESAAAVTGATREETVAYDEMSEKIRADLASMEAAQAKAATANETVTATMAGTAAGMGRMSVAAGEAKASYANTAGAVGLTAKQLMILGTAAAVVGGATVKMAGDFESSTQRLVSSAGEIQSNLGIVRTGMLQVSSETGYMADQVSKAMYKIESGGQHGAAGITVLRAAAEGARAENADLTVVADAVTSALTDYHLKASDAATVTSKLVAATASGKMTFEELASSMANILPVASADHVSLNDILGDLASMTTHGMTAQRASQNLADTLQHMAAPTMVQSKELAALGISSTDLSQSLGKKGLSGTLDMIQKAIQKDMGPSATAVILNLQTALKGLDPQVQALGMQLLQGTVTNKQYQDSAAKLPPILAKQAQSFGTLAGSMHTIGTRSISGAQVIQSYTGAMQRATGDATSMRTALMLTGENMGTTENALKAVSGATAEAGNHVRGWSEIQKTFNQKMKEAHASLDALAIQIGQVLLPVVSEVAGGFAKFTQFLANHKSAAIALAVVVGGILVVAFAAAAAAAWAFTAAMLADPLTWIIVAVVAVVAALVALVVVIVKHWGSIKQFFEKLWRGIVDAFRAAGHRLKVAWDAVVDWVKSAARAIAKPFEDAWAAVKRVFSMSPGEIGQAIGRALGETALAIGKWAVGMWHDITAGFRNCVHAAKQFGHDFIAGLLIAWQWLMALPGKIMGLFASAGHWLVNAASALWRGYLNALVKFWSTVWDWISNAPENIKRLFADAKSWLAHTGKDLWDGLLHGLRAAWSSVTSAIGDFVGGIVRGFKKGLGIASPSTIFANIGKDIFYGLLNGLKAIWSAVNSFFGGIPGKVLGFFSNAGKLLWAAGYNIMVSLYNGLVSMWGKVTGFVGGIGNWISSHKGPIEVDRVLLTPHGKAIMQGFHAGLVQENKTVQAWVSSVPQQLTTALHGASSGGFAAGQSYASSLAAGLRANQNVAVAAAKAMAAGVAGVQVNAGAVAAGSTAGYAMSGPAGVAASTAHTVLNLNVAGHVWTTKDLVAELQTELTRVGMRNTTNGTSYLGFNR